MSSAEFNERLTVAAVYDRRKISGEDDDAERKPATVTDRRYMVRIELDEGAKNLILAEGFSKEYGARNLERAVDRLLGTLLAEALLSGEITAGQTLHLEAVDGRILFREDF
ncbi:MAG: hypothetical protein MUF86_12470 [Akkermansiaceae bacterium]|nr:hypothetical protein [Akkermansiaceae bacterium]